MATTSPDGLISPDAGDPYDLTADMAAMQASTQAALVNRASKSGPNSAMQSASNVRTGTFWFNTTDKALYRFNGSGWDAMTGGDTGWVDITGSLRPGFTSPDLKARRVGDLVSIQGTVTGTIPVSSANPTTLGTIPSQFRPSSLTSTSTLRYTSGIGFAPLFLRVLSSGILEVVHLLGTLPRDAVHVSLTYMV